MSESLKERRRALVFLAAMSLILALVALSSLVLPQPQATPGVTVTAILLLAGSGYGVVASSVAFARTRPNAADEAPGAPAEVDRAAE